MTPTRALLTTAVAALVATLAIAGTAAAANGPTYAAGLGCEVQCISKAKVTATATNAKVDLATTVLAHLKVTISKQASGSGGFVIPTAKTVHVSAYSPKKLAFFLGLEPNMTYTISVTATDIEGRASTRHGTFKTLPIKTTGIGGPTTIDSGAGCSAQCITRALVKQGPPDGTKARIDIRTSTKAHVQIDVSRDKPVQTAAGLAQYDVVSRQWTTSDTTSWTPTVSGLDYGTRYYVVVRARDAQGRVSFRQGSFRTVSATAVVTVYRIKVQSDGDKVGRGELFFRLWLGDDDYASWGTGMRKLSGGDTTPVNWPGSNRPGVSFTVPANGDATFRMAVLGEECDAVFKKSGCIIEAGRGGSPWQHAWAGGTFHVRDLLGNGALPAWYGTGVTPPAGHDGYFVLGTGSGSVAFLVLAAIDLRVDWP